MSGSISCMALLPNEPNGEIPPKPPILKPPFDGRKAWLRAGRAGCRVDHRGCGACVQAKRLLDGKRVFTRNGASKTTSHQRSLPVPPGARTAANVAEHRWGFDDLVNLDRSGELTLPAEQNCRSRSLSQRLKSGLRLRFHGQALIRRHLSHHAPQRQRPRNEPEPCSQDPLTGWYGRLQHR